MVADHLAPGMADRGHRIVAGEPDRGVGQPLGQDLAAPQAQAAQQVLVALHMAVQRRLAHPQGIGHPGEGQLVESLGVGNGGGRGDHPIGVQGAPGRGGVVPDGSHGAPGGSHL